MKKTVKVVMLPTEKAPDKDDIILIDFKDNTNPLLAYASEHAKDISIETQGNINHQHLYLISDDEIKEGDWVIENSNIIVKVVSLFEDNCLVKNNTAYNTNLKLCKKIVATTDNSINVNYPIAEIPESFIQAYIESYNNGKPITEVDLEYKLDNYNLKGNKRIITPKTRPDNTVIVHQSKMYSKKEVEKLCEKAFRAGREAQSNLNANRCPSAWIEDNL